MSQLKIQKLHRLGLVHRWKLVEASNFHRLPSVVLISARGARLVAGYLKVDPKPLVAQAEDALYNSGSVVHDLEANQFFIDLARQSAVTRGEGLFLWHGEATRRRRLREVHYRKGDRVPAPDGFGLYLSGNAEIKVDLEWDRGTASLSRLWAKVDTYLDAYTRYEDPKLSNVLFVVQHPDRAEKVRSLLWRATSKRYWSDNPPSFWVATAEELWQRGPLAPIWYDPKGLHASAARPYRGRAPLSLDAFPGRKSQDRQVECAIGKACWWERRLAGGESE